MTMRILMIAAGVALGHSARAALLDDRAAVARGAIEESERRQREVLAHVYTLDQSIKASSKRAVTLNRRAADFEVEARRLGGEVHDFETRGADRGRQMNRRLVALYRRRAGAGAWRSLFTVDSPGALDRQRRFTRAMIDDDRQRIDEYVAALHASRTERRKLDAAVRRLVNAQREARATEVTLAARRAEKARLVAELGATRESRLSELRELRTEGAVEELAFFERRGSLHGPVARAVTRTFGTVNDPGFKFKLMHKGWFYGDEPGASVAAIAGGRVDVARDLPGWGPTVIVDHGDHYRSVYACASRIKVREGDVVEAGQPIGFTGEHSPLFGPGLYFELRHFADAIDPRTWIKDPEFTNADHN